MSIDAEDGTITRLLNRSTEFEATLQFEFPEEQLSLPTMEQRHKIAANAALLAIEHASALRASAQVKAMNSAAGLLRLQYEAVLRAAWLLYSASPGQVKKLTSSLDLDAEQIAKNLPGYLEMLAAIEKSTPEGLAAPLVEFNRYSRHALNSFVHAGIHPLYRSQSGFPPALAETILKFSAGLMHFAYRILAALTGSQERMNRVTRAYMAFQDCLPMVPSAEASSAS